VAKNARRKHSIPPYTPCAFTVVPLEYAQDGPAPAGGLCPALAMHPLRPQKTGSPHAKASECDGQGADTIPHVFCTDSCLNVSVILHELGARCQSRGSDAHDARGTPAPVVPPGSSGPCAAPRCGRGMGIGVVAGCWACAPMGQCTRVLPVQSGACLRLRQRSP
jgi:hypothetical protein